MFKEDHLSFRQRKYMKVKNIIGRALGGIGLVVLSPVYLAIIVAIKKEDGITAPVFFSQKRVGIHKEYFNLYKFRSMRTDTPHDKPTHLLENPDQYITKVGRFLRKSSLDELPQLWNIARGDMAVIGPRPALWNQDDLIAERDKYGANDVKPGLTGWAQINGRDELEIPVKARLDGEYVKKMGPLMDIRCFIGTVFSVLRSDGVVEGGTGAKKKLMVITNHSYMLWQFRRELIGKLMEDYDVIISTPFVGHEDDFKAMGCTMIETDVDRRGINPKTDMKLYLTYRRLLKEHHPDMVVTYSIKPNVYAGYACRQMRIPYCVNVQGLGTAFQKKGLREIVIRMYKTALKKAKTVYFENKGNAKVFLQEQIIRREQMCLLKGAGVNLKYYTYQKYPENDKVHFLYLGRIMKEKGMDELFYAAKELQRKEVPFVLDLVGFFEDEYKEKIDKLVDAGIAVFHGFQEDPRPYYAMADCVVLPSYHEGLGGHRQMKFFRKHKKRKIAGIIILLIVLLIGGIYGSIWWKFYGDSVGVVSADKVDPKAKKVKIAKEKRKDKDVYNVLLVGTDSRDPDADRGRSDSMMMVSFNKKEGKSTAISFLRDSLVDIDGHGKSRLGHTYAYGGVGLTINTINKTYDLDIQNYITISFDDLVNVIDEIGGVTVFISEEEAAYYRENGMPDIQAGDVTLTGSQALAHARNRTLGNDFERTRRQRSVMYGIYRKIMEKKDPSALLPLINYAVNHVRTNMSVSEMYSMAKDVLSVDDLKMQQTCIPQDGTYTDITYEGMQVLKVDFDANKKKIEQLLY